MQYDSYQHIHIHTPCMVLYQLESMICIRAYMKYVCIILSIHCTVHTCLYSSYSVHCTPRIVCIREYYELVCILLLASTLEYGMHTTTLVVIPTYYSYYAYQLVVRGRSVHCIHTTSEEYIRAYSRYAQECYQTSATSQQSMHTTRVVCILRVVEEESTHDQRHNFCLILASIILRVV